MELFYSTDIRYIENHSLLKRLFPSDSQKFPAASASSGERSRMALPVAVLTGSEAEHCAKVLRHKVGDEIFIIDGVGGLYRCRIISVETPKRVAVEVRAEVLEKSFGVGGRNYRLVMAVCPTKNIDRYEWFVEKATELGVDEIVPIISDHSVRTSVKKERLEALALSATKQSLKSYLPKIADSISVACFLGKYACGNELKLIAYCEDGDKKTIRKRLDDFRKVSPVNRGSQRPEDSRSEKMDVVMMIGPEGDFSQKEIDLAIKNGFLPVTLGASRLRVETAAVASVNEIYFASLE